MTKTKQLKLTPELKQKSLEQFTKDVNDWQKHIDYQRELRTRKNSRARRHKKLRTG